MKKSVVLILACLLFMVTSSLGTIKTTHAFPQNYTYEVIWNGTFNQNVNAGDTGVQTLPLFARFQGYLYIIGVGEIGSILGSSGAEIHIWIAQYADGSGGILGRFDHSYICSGYMQEIQAWEADITQRSELSYIIFENPGTASASVYCESTIWEGRPTPSGNMSLPQIILIVGVVSAVLIGVAYLEKRRRKHKVASEKEKGN